MSYDPYPVPRADLEARIIARARTDARFLDLLREEPRRAVGDVLGCDVPEGMTVRVVEERADCLCVVLPVDLSGISAGAVAAAVGRSRSAAMTAGAPSVETLTTRRRAA